MPEEKKVEEAVETTETNSTETSESIESSSQTVADSVAERLAAQPKAEPEDTTVEEAETSEPLAEDTKAEEVAQEVKDSDEVDTPAEEKTDEQTEETGDDVSSFLEDTVQKKSGLEKRVDKLTAERYQKDAKIAELEARLDEREKVAPTGDKKRFTTDQLARAMMKAHEDNDPALMAEILKQQDKQTKDDLRKEYEQREKSKIEEANRNRQEWTQVQKDWEYLSDEKAELYPNSSKELDLRSNESLIRRVALFLYNSQQEDLFQRYHRPGGQGLAVQDAFKAILKKRRGTTSDTTETKSLKKRLTKERRKTSLAGGSKRVKTEPSTKAKKPLSNAEKVLEAIEERKKPIQDRIASYAK